MRSTASQVIHERSRSALQRRSESWNSALLNIVGDNLLVDRATIAKPAENSREERCLSGFLPSVRLCSYRARFERGEWRAN